MHWHRPINQTMTIKLMYLYKVYETVSNKLNQLKHCSLVKEYTNHKHTSIRTRVSI